MAESTLRIAFFASMFLSGSVLFGQTDLPHEPIEIGHQPQFLLDHYVVDNHWAIKYKREAVTRIHHQAKKHAANPVLTGDQPSFVWVIRDPATDLFRMYYQANFPTGADAAGARKFRTHIAYAQSQDGIHWDKPDLDQFSWHQVEPNNVVIGRESVPAMESCGPCILEVPESERKGFRYLMLYRSKGRGIGELSGIRVIGSHNGVDWDQASDRQIADLHSDHHNTVSYDEVAQKYVMFCRAKHIYRAWGDDMIDTGASRRVARMTSDSLWNGWMDENQPQTVLVPDEIDSQTRFNFFYGMPTRRWAGIYWGFLEPFRMNDYIYTQLATSRDGIHFTRPALRDKLIEFGDEGTWDDTMIFASPSWVEVGDQWWIYYSGWDGPHGTSERTGAIGLATIRKEGFVSMRGPSGGGVVCTRSLRWPGGRLIVNADASDGELKVRVSDAFRKPISGFDYHDCQPLTDDQTSHLVQWNDAKLEKLRGQVIRLEFFIRDADLYTFRASTD